MNVPVVPVAVTIGSQSLEATLRAQFKDKSPTVEELAPVAMRLCRDETHAFLSRSDEETFKIGVGALLLFFKDDHEVRRRIEHEVRMLSALSAATNGLPIDWGSLVNDDTPKLIGLIGMYRDSKP